jgi:beta-1,4-mannosyl-glycoprotein beta-1,4-N-acetylglucosaminyltransferase
MIYSTTIFMNELDLLDLKIAEERSHVDQILITEAAVTFSGREKPQNWPPGRYDKDPKVRYIMMDMGDFPADASPRDREEVQRCHAIQSLDLADDDVVFVSDLDEIIDGRCMDELVTLTRKHGMVSLGMKCCYYYVNLYRGPWVAAYAATGSLLKTYSPNGLRYFANKLPEYRNFPIPVYQAWGTGWHFSFLGGPDAIREKARSFCHVHYGGDAFVGPGEIEKHLKARTDVFHRSDEPMEFVPLDMSYPRNMVLHIHKWEKYFCDPTKS